MLEDHDGFGAALRQARVALGMTQRELAAVLGTAQAVVSRWENGLLATMPTRAQIGALEKAVRLRPGALTVHLGYVPLAVLQDSEAAINADPRFTSEQKRLLIGLIGQLAT